MGNCAHMRGRAKIKPEFKEIVRPRFTKNEQGKWLAEWDELDLPAEIKDLPAFQLLTNPEGHGKQTPGAHVSGSCLFGSEPDPETGYYGYLHYSEDGLLEFSMAHKNRNQEQEAFVKFLALIADEWKIEQDLSELADRPEHISWTSVLPWQEINYSALIASIFLRKAT